MAKGIYVGVKSTLDPTQDSFKIVSSSKQDFVDRKIIVPGGVGGSKYWDTTNMTSSTFYPNEAVDFASSTIWPSSFNFSNKFFLFSNDLTHLYKITSVSNKTEIKTEISTRALDPGSSVEITANGSVYDIAENSSVARKVKKMYVGVDTQVPIMSETTQQLTLNDTNLKEFFDVSAETGTNKWTPLNITGGGVSFSPGNYGVNSTTATCTLTAKENLTNIVIGYSYVTEKSYDKVTVVRNGSTLLNAASGSNTGTFDATTLAKGQTIKLTYTKDSSQSASGEKVNIDITCDPIEKTVQTITGYEMQEIARKIKKGYVGVGGVARPFFSGGEVLTYYGEVTPLSARVSAHASAAIKGKYAFFAGGIGYSDSISNRIDAYNPELVKSTLFFLESNYAGYYYLAGGNTDHYAIFAGGTNSYAQHHKHAQTQVTAVDENLTRAYPTALSSERIEAGAATINNHLIILSGYANYTYYSTAEIYDDNLVKGTNITLPSAKINSTDVSAKNYAIFAGGSSSDKVNSVGNSVFAFSADLALTTVPSLTLKRWNGAGGATPNNILIAGGASSSHNSYLRSIETYSQTLVKGTSILLPRQGDGGDYGLSAMASASTEDNVIFWKGWYAYSYSDENDETQWDIRPINSYYIYNDDLIRTDGSSSRRVAWAEGQTIGSYVLFAGGRGTGTGSSNWENTVEALKIN